MRYRCLILDHDDTVVNSTATIHFPCFLEYIQKYFPDAYRHGYTFDEYVIKNFHPGIVALFRDEIGMTDEDMLREQSYWFRYAQQKIAPAFPGIREILWKHKHCGGLITVVSHSYNANILRDYRENGFPEPDLVFGWDSPPEQRKPSTYPLEQILAHFNLRREDMLMVDDLKPGYDMAKAFGIAFAAAGWAYNIPEIESFMRANCDYYLKTVADFSDFLSGASQEAANG